MHVPTNREGRKELGINGSSDLVDLGTFREDSQIDFFQLVFCPYSVLGLLSNSFSISVCVLPPEFVNSLLIYQSII